MKFVCYAGYLLLFIGFIAKSAQAISLEDKSIMRTKVFSVAIECVQSNPLTLAEIKSFRNKTLPDGQNPKCFTACLYKKMGIMDDMGMLSPAGARKKAEMVFKEDKELLKNVDELMQSCLYVNQQKTDDGNKGCDRAKLAFRCLTENGPKYGFDLS